VFNRVAELEEKMEKLEHKVTELEKAALRAAGLMKGEER